LAGEHSEAVSRRVNRRWRRLPWSARRRLDGSDFLRADGGRKRSVDDLAALCEEGWGTRLFPGARPAGERSAPAQGLL